MQDLKSYPPVEGNEKRVNYTLYGNAYIFIYFLHTIAYCFLHTVQGTKMFSTRLRFDRVNIHNRVSTY